jgi:hypothetical protein
MKEFKFIHSQDIFSRFRAKPNQLPFKAIQSSTPIPRGFYLKPFCYGIIIGSVLEASMIKFGYYEAFIKAERKRLIAKEKESQDAVLPQD